MIIITIRTTTTTTTVTSNVRFDPKLGSEAVMGTKPKVVSGPAGYILEDVPHLSDYIPNLPVRRRFWVLCFSLTPTVKTWNAASSPPDQRSCLPFFALFCSVSSFCFLFFFSLKCFSVIKKVATFVFFPSAECRHWKIIIALIYFFGAIIIIIIWVFGVLLFFFCLQIRDE